jgi:hypothetical protein
MRILSREMRTRIFECLAAMAAAYSMVACLIAAQTTTTPATWAPGAAHQFKLEGFGGASLDQPAAVTIAGTDADDPAAREKPADGIVPLVVNTGTDELANPEYKSQYSIAVCVDRPGEKTRKEILTVTVVSKVF